MKQCKGCNEIKNLTDFRYHIQRQIFSGKCKTCISKQDKEKYYRPHNVLKREQKRLDKLNKPKTHKNAKINKYDPKCAYHLCLCRLERHQYKYKAQINHKDYYYCSAWCREIDTIDKKLIRMYGEIPSLSTVAL